ncbi:MAG: hypothetical protein J1F35_06575 [Erysipelotrichales bacterium]|nr:hypothetical protein [Erysipelotrichales bacterium]
MRSLLEFLDDEIFESQMIFERNEKMYPYPGSEDKRTKFEIWVGDHGRQRMNERKVSEKQIVDAFYAAWSQLNQKFKDREFEADRNGNGNEIVIIDARKNRQKPLTIAAFLYRNRANNKLLFPAFTVKTVYYDTGGAAQNRKDRIKIFLY